MKTTDLIPLILLELNERDKYGFELTKNIETKSNGKIVIKQPTLYTLLKKLEKSKFIASYWQDSEIGGKRHYYKLTQNGRLQVSTLPSYESLLQNALDNDSSPNVNSSETNRTTIEEDNHIILTQSPTPIETILPSTDIFVENSIDTATEFEINSSNSDILKDGDISRNEQFADNSNVAKFTEKFIDSAPEIEIKNTKNQRDILDVDLIIPKTEISIKHVDYIDFKNCDYYKYSKKISKNLLFQSLATSLSLISMIVICSLITILSSRSGLYYFFLICSILISLFYPIIVSINMNRTRLRFQTRKYKKKTKIKLFVGLSLMLLVVLFSVIVNVCIDNNTIKSILHFKNFENFYAPILFFSIYFLDVLYNYLFFKKVNKS